MKKILKSIIISLIILFLILIPKINANTKENYKYKETIHSIKFKNLNSKNLNELFNNISGTIIRIEVKTSYFTKTYNYNTNFTLDVEKSLIENVTKDLENLGKRELATTIRIEGIKITKMDIRCTYEELELITSRAEVE